MRKEEEIPEHSNAGMQIKQTKSTYEKKNKNA